MVRNLLLLGLFCIGVGVFIFPYVAQKTTYHAQVKEVNEIKNEFELMPLEAKREKVVEAQACNEAIFTNEEGIRDPFTEGYDHNEFKNCKGAPAQGENVGAIEIPKLDLHIPLYIGATENELSRGVGQVDGSSLPFGGKSTHTVLAGHRGAWTKAMFRHLDELQKGDVFYLHTYNGKLAYRVYDIGVVLPYETETLQIVGGQDFASLITCHPYGQNSHRLVVYGERVEE